jgi:radical SAM protein with 4Fe4S-binding SPASM domain
MRKSFVPKGKNLTLDEVKGLFNKMPYINNVCIQGLCEPYMNKEMPQILKWLRTEKHYFMSFTTNGTIPIVGDRLECLRYVDDMVVSMDTSDPKTFAELRNGATLQTVMENLMRIIKWKHENHLGKSANPPLHINAVITAKNFDQMPLLFDMLEPYAEDINYLMVDPVTRPDYSPVDPLPIYHDEEFEKKIKEMRKVAKQHKLPVLGLDYMLEPSHDWKDCELAWFAMPVQPNGDVYYCYFDYENVIGNVFEQDPLEIWNSPKAREFRRKLVSSDPPIQQCKCCNFARRGWQYELSKEESYLVKPQDRVTAE